MPDEQMVELLDVATIYSGGTPSKSEPRFWGGSLPWLSAKDLKSTKVGDSIDRVTEAAVGNGTRAVAAGATLVLVRGMQLFKSVPVALTTARVTFNQDVKAVVPNGSVDAAFLAYSLQAREPQLALGVTAAGHGTGRLSTEVLETLPIWLPSRSEQRRITALLETWDGALLAAERLTALAERKQAAMLQDLFTNDGAATGTLGDYFTERKKWGRSGLPVYSVTLEGGLTPREQLDRRTKSALADDAHALVEQGDLAYNMMRMWQGALGISDRSCLVSPAYVVMQPLPSVDVRFAAAWMKSPRGLDRLWAYSHGITEDRLRLYADDFLAIPVSFPPLDRQKAVGRAHETAAQAAREARAFAALLRRQKRGLMQKLLTGEWRVPATGDAFAPGGTAVDRLEAAE